MTVDSIREFCLSFPSATEKLQWGDDLCFKVAGKIFAIVGLDTLRLCFKCTPETFAELIEREGLRPAPYVGRYKWVLAENLTPLADDETRDLIAQSYDMVVAKAPKKRARNPRPRRTRRTRAAGSKKKRPSD